MSRLCFVSPIIVGLFLSSSAFADDGYLSRLGLYTSPKRPWLGLRGTD